MADFQEEIRQQPGHPFAQIERKGIRFFLERDIARERFKKATARYIAYLAPAAGLAVALISLYRSFFGGH